MNTEKKYFEEYQEIFKEQTEVFNTTPRVEIDNLSADDLHYILYETFDEESPIGFKLKIKDDVLNKIPFLRLVKEFLSILQEHKELKLTNAGYLPPKICLELYNKRIITEESIEKGIVKLNKEVDSLVLQNVKIMSELSGLTKKRYNKLSLTKNGYKLLANKSDTELLKKLFIANYQKFNLGYHDLYPQAVGIQATFGYTLYLLLKYGSKKRPFGFYTKYHLIAFPRIMENFDEQRSTPTEQFKMCYSLRIFERFLTYYGFINSPSTQELFFEEKKAKLSTTQLFNEVFEIRKEKFKFLKSKHLA